MIAALKLMQKETGKAELNVNAVVAFCTIASSPPRRDDNSQGQRSHRRPPNDILTDIGAVVAQHRGGKPGLKLIRMQIDPTR